MNKYNRVQKVCLNCGIDFTVPKHRDNFVKFCSMKCKNESLIGHIPWNKGIKNPYTEEQLENIKAGWKKIKDLGWKPWNAGKPVDEKQREKLRLMNLSQSRMKKPTSLEKIVIKFLDYKNIKYQFQVFIKNKWSCDFYIKEKNLIIEADGEYWHSQPKTVIKDKSKNKYLKKCGYNLIRLSEKELKSGSFKERLAICL